jgi:hypothetical protein
LIRAGSFHSDIVAGNAHPPNIVGSHRQHRIDVMVIERPDELPHNAGEVGRGCASGKKEHRQEWKPYQRVKNAPAYRRQGPSRRGARFVRTHFS